MKKVKQYIQPGFFLLIILSGFFLHNFFGGFLVGTGACLIIFVTAGRVLFHRSMREIDAAAGEQ